MDVPILQDPVRGYAPKESLSDSLISLLAVGAHTEDLLAPNPANAPSLHALRQQVLGYFSNWTQEFYASQQAKRA